MRKMALGALAVIAALAAYLLLWPVAVDPVPWAAPAPPGYSGPHAGNDKLKDLTLIALPPGESGPEHVALGQDGKLFNAQGDMPWFNVKPGTLDDTSWVVPGCHMWTQHKQPWIKFSDTDVVFEQQPSLDQIPLFKPPSEAST